MPKNLRSVSRSKKHIFLALTSDFFHALTGSKRLFSNFLSIKKKFMECSKISKSFFWCTQVTFSTRSQGKNIIVKLFVDAQKTIMEGFKISKHIFFDTCEWRSSSQNLRWTIPYSISRAAIRADGGVHPTKDYCQNFVSMQRLNLFKNPKLRSK